MSYKGKSIFDARYRQFIDGLIAHRKSTKTTQRELAKKLGTSNCYVARIETRERRIDIIESIDMMRALNMSDEQIINELKKLMK